VEVGNRVPGEGGEVGPDDAPARRGQKFFCADANISMLQKAEPRLKYYFCLHANETLNRLEQTPKLVIAALNGHTVGGGLDIAMAGDLCIGPTDAGRVGCGRSTWASSPAPAAPSV
jgi:enoyl-CoA hydratase